MGGDPGTVSGQKKQVSRPKERAYRRCHANQFNHEVSGGKPTNAIGHKNMP